MFFGNTFFKTRAYCSLGQEMKSVRINRKEMKGKSKNEKGNHFWCIACTVTSRPQVG